MQTGRIYKIPYGEGEMLFRYKRIATREDWKKHSGTKSIHKMFLCIPMASSQPGLRGDEWVFLDWEGFEPIEVPVMDLPLYAGMKIIYPAFMEALETPLFMERFNEL